MSKQIIAEGEPIGKGKESTSRSSRRRHSGYRLAADRFEDFILCESGLIRVPSRTVADRFYSVDPKRQSCTCRDYQAGNRCAHLWAVDGCLEARDNARVDGVIGRIRTANLLRLMAEVAKPPEVGESPSRSMDLCYQVQGYHLSPWTLVEESQERHRKVLDLERVA